MGPPRIIRWLLVVAICIVTSPDMEAYSKDIIFIFDGSGSMNGKTADGKRKINVAREVLTKQIEKLDPGESNVGLIAYGHRVKGDCTDIEQLVPMKPLVGADFINKISTIGAKGKTPIAASIRLATEQLVALEDEAAIVLISDGEETCDADPCQAAGDLKDAGINFVIHAVGFDVNQEQRQQLQCLADVTDGQYLSANDEEGLTVALRKVVELEPVKIVQENIQIILDTSQSMAGQFDGRTRLAAAREALEEILAFQVKDRDNLAFRTYGGTCGSDSTVLHDGFNQNSEANIKQSFQDLRPSGDATIKAGALAAMRDFQDSRRFPADVRKRVIIIAGGPACHPNDPYDIQQNLQTNQIDLEYYPIGLGIPPTEIVKFEDIGHATGRPIKNVQTTDELKRLLRNIIEIEPVRDSLRDVQAIVYEVIEDLNKMVDSANEGNDGQAEELRSAARKRLDGTARNFSDLRKRAAERQDFGQLYEMAKSVRKTQSDNLEIAKLFIQLRRDGNTEESNLQIEEYNRNTVNMNETLKQIQSLVSQLTY